MLQDHPVDKGNEELWQTIFAVGHPDLKSFQRFHSALPSPPRCKMCYAPFKGVGGFYMRIRGKAPANRNPRYCSACDKFLRAFPGGAEVEMSMMFVDVRNSVPMAENMSPSEFSSFLDVFYRAATKALIETDGFVIEFRGDAVLGVYPPGFTGPDHAKKVFDAARLLVEELAAHSSEGLTLPIGAGIHTGTVYIGTVSGAEEGIQDLSVLGDSVNIAARLAQEAKPGEVLVSQFTAEESGYDLQTLTTTEVSLKGKSAPLTAYVIH